MCDPLPPVRGICFFDRNLYCLSWFATRGLSSFALAMHDEVRTCSLCRDGFLVGQVPTNQRLFNQISFIMRCSRTLFRVKRIVRVVTLHRRYVGRSQCRCCFCAMLLLHVCANLDSCHEAGRLFLASAHAPWAAVVVPVIVKLIACPVWVSGWCTSALLAGHHDAGSKRLNHRRYVRSSSW